jgi:hypothetical protein
MRVVFCLLKKKVIVELLSAPKVAWQWLQELELGLGCFFWTQAQAQVLVFFVYLKLHCLARTHKGPYAMLLWS